MATQGFDHDPDSIIHDEALSIPDQEPQATVLTDVNGLAIAPIPTPTLIGFDTDPTSPRDNLESAKLQQASMRGLGSHLDPQPPSSTKSSTVRKSSSAPVTDDAFDIPRLKRVKTAPAENGGRPRANVRSSTGLGDIRRNPTGVGLNGRRGEPYAYTFDPLSSDDDLSSSDDEAPGKGDKKEKLVSGSRPAEKGGQQVKETAKKRHSYSRFAVGNEHFKTKGRISKRDGRLNISINETANSGFVAKALGHTIKHHLDIPKRHKSKKHRQEEERDEELAKEDEDVESDSSSLHTTAPCPRLNIVIMVIGSRGDIQPFVKIARILKNDYGHRVRIASHPTFRDFVQKDQGLDFFSVGGDPSELMAFMVKNPGLIPNLQTLREGEIRRRRAAMGVMFEGFWRACINTTDDETDKENLKMIGDKEPFVANAIIANPPSMAHVHIAEKLGIPLHIMFTFPYTPTQAFPHPLANIKPHKSNVDESYLNFMSYPLVEMMTWQGLGDIVNRFRASTLGLEPVSSLWAPGALYRMKVPYTYLWSPSLVPKPKDWGPEIDIAGFVFLDLASNFKPDKELEDFLKAGEPPVYIGFGSIVVDDPNAFTEMIFEATKMAGVRALVNKGWGGLGRSNNDTPDHIFMLGNTPHDWLFPKCSAVVHHGGAGTTAIGLKCGKPTMIVPFFGDQPWWGRMVAESKAGAHKAIPYKRLTAEWLAEGIKQCQDPEALEHVQKVADSIAEEGDGAMKAVTSFHRSLPLAGRHNMRCSILEERVAVWQLRGSSLRLSALAAELLHEKGRIKWKDLKLLRHYEWNDFDGPGEPITGSVGAFTTSLYNMGKGVGMVPIRVAEHVRKHEEHERKKAEAHRRKAERRRRKEAEVQKSELAGRADVCDGLNEIIEIKQEVSTDGNPPRPLATRASTTTTLGSVLSAGPSKPLPREIAGDFALGFKTTGAALLTMPNDLHVAIAQGFHNAPRLYGDVTVRKPVRITGFKSGCLAARKEFVYGISDAWSGLIMQPVGDWQDGDTVAQKFAGLGTGIGKGVGGFMLKNISAVVAPPAYVFKGLLVWAERKSHGPDSKSFIRRAHIIQGHKDILALRDGEGDDVDDQLRRVQERVDHGWDVYEEVWNTAHQHVGGQFIGRYKFDKEQKKWEVNGVLENVHTADRALHAQKEGRDLQKMFARRRKEMREAEQPRAPVMELPELLEKTSDALPKGSKHTAPAAEDRSPRHNLDLDSDSRKMSKLSEGNDSDATAVATPEEDHKTIHNPIENVVIKGQDANAAPCRSLAVETS